MVYFGTIEANCIIMVRQPVSLLFPPHSETRKRGGNNKETTSLLVLYNDACPNKACNQGDHSVINLFL